MNSEFDAIVLAGGRGSRMGGQSQPDFVVCGRRCWTSPWLPWPGRGVWWWSGRSRFRLVCCWPTWSRRSADRSPVWMPATRRCPTMRRGLFSWLATCPARRLLYDSFWHAYRTPATTARACSTRRAGCNGCSAVTGARSWPGGSVSAVSRLSGRPAPAPRPAQSAGCCPQRCARRRCRHPRGRRRLGRPVNGCASRRRSPTA